MGKMNQILQAQSKRRKITGTHNTGFLSKFLSITGNSCGFLQKTMIRKDEVHKYAIS